MAPEIPTAGVVVILISGAFLLGWVIWAFREYSRTGKAQWLWMGLVMAVALVTTISRLR